MEANSLNDTDTTMPILCGSTVLAQPGSPTPFENNQLSNPNGMPMELLEVRVRLTPQPTKADSFQSVTGMAVNIKMMLGQASVVDESSPVSMFSGVRDTFENSTQMYGNQDDATILVFPTEYSWRLRNPLFIPAGSVLSATATPAGQSPYPIKVDILYICRSWDVSKDLPKVVRVPWVATYQSKSFNYLPVALATSGEDVSPNLEIVNPFGVPLELTRLCGRVSFTQTQAANGALAPIGEEIADVRQRLARVRIRSSRGFDVIRTPTLFGSVFPLNNRAWEVPHKWNLSPQEYYSVRINYAKNDIETMDAKRRGQVQFAVGIVGSRLVDVSFLGGVKS